INFAKFDVSRAELMIKLREKNIGTQVHYIPVHLQPYYRDFSNTKPGDFPNAEKYYQKALSIPMYPQLTESDCDRVLDEIKRILYRD
ncbi:MAG: UDP-4-amino-4,6-dideoxy-N-acetyl-beta-L-altrosamine transaminase, partial [candidate division Zixibacteria bacterium]|nr:UDP-4-amino-4,6-dideoxy-N-acetyl-beta-L-altrosamine transaminase [candidate division Zixibacteria bacterium]